MFGGGPFGGQAFGSFLSSDTVDTPPPTPGHQDIQDYDYISVTDWDTSVTGIGPEEIVGMTEVITTTGLTGGPVNQQSFSGTDSLSITDPTPTTTGLTTSTGGLQFNDSDSIAVSEVITTTGLTTTGTITPTVGIHGANANTTSGTYVGGGTVAAGMRDGNDATYITSTGPVNGNYGYSVNVLSIDSTEVPVGVYISSFQILVRASSTNSAPISASALSLPGGVSGGSAQPAPASADWVSLGVMTRAVQGSQGLVWSTAEFDQLTFTLSTTATNAGPHRLYEILIQAVYIGVPGGGTTPLPPLIPREIWTVDNVPIQTYAYNVVTWGGSRQKPRALRGTNAKIPYRPGQRWKPKTPDSNVLSLGMWVIGANADGSIGNRTTFETNWRKLRRLFWTADREVQIQKTFYDDVAGGQVTANGKAQYADGLELEMNGERRGAFVVDLVMANPFFYDTNIRSVSVGISGTQSIACAGDYPTTKMTIALIGPLTRPTLTDTTGAVSLTYNGDIASGDTVTIDVDNFKATRNNGASVISLISHSGSKYWMRLAGPDVKATSGNIKYANVLDLAAVAGSGTANIQYTPVYL